MLGTPEMFRIRKRDSEVSSKTDVGLDPIRLDRFVGLSRDGIKNSCPPKISIGRLVGFVHWGRLESYTGMSL